MIKKTQIRFIYTTMLILFCVFLVIFFGMTRILGIFNVNHIDNILTTDARDFDQSSNYDIKAGQIIIVGNNYIYDANKYSLEETENLYKTALERNVIFGNVGNVYYKFVSNNGLNLFIANDFTNDVNERHSNIITVLIVLSIIYALLSIIVYLLSLRVIRPIKDAFNRQNQFISDASHELKTPLTIISANADVLQQGDNNNQWVENIKQQTNRMEVLVADMLTLAKMEEKSTKLIKESFNLSEEVLTISLSFDALAFEKKKTLDSEIFDNIYITGDKNSAKKVCSILLDNAIKYATSFIKISLFKYNDKTILEVYNDGSNIPNEDSDKMFERFYRGDLSRSRESGGSGLGLAIAKGICDNNKWKIYAKSELGKCMTIRVIM